MIDIGPLLSDCPFRVLCNLVQGELDYEQLSLLVQSDVSKTSYEQRDNLGAGHRGCESISNDPEQ
jgi:hypothetical protein